MSIFKDSYEKGQEKDSYLLLLHRTTSEQKAKSNIVGKENILMKILTSFVLDIKFITDDSETILAWTEEGLVNFIHCREHHQVGAKRERNMIIQNRVMWPCILFFIALKVGYTVSAYPFFRLLHNV